MLILCPIRREHHPDGEFFLTLSLDDPTDALEPFELMAEALTRAATNDADADVRRSAINALGDIGTPAARAALVDLLNRN